MKSVYFSIVIPLFNKEKSIISTVNSVLKQTYPYFEVLIVNDGSTDNSLKMVETIEDKRIKIIDKENGGVSSARNAGIKAAQHNWVSFLDADDLWYPNHLEVTKQLINKFPKASVIGTDWKSDSDAGSTRDENSFYLKNYYKASLIKEPLCSSVVTVRRSCFKDLGLFNEDLTHGEDRLMWVQLANRFKIAKSTKVTAIYRKEAENRAMNLNIEFNDAFINKLINECEKNSEKHSFKKYIEQDLKREFKRNLKAGKNILVFKKVLKYKNFIVSNKTFYKYLFYCFLPVRYLNKFRN